MVLQWSQQTVVGPHRIAIYKSVKKHSATEQMSQTQAQLVKGFSNTSASADVITVDSSANVGINKTSPVKDLDVTGEIRASTGMLFGTDTAAANTLDDYEEGTWTAVFKGATTAGTYTYDSNFANYTKIGNLVTVQCALTNITTSSAGTGQLIVSGAPFTAKSGSGTHQGSVRLSRFNVVDDAVNIVASINGGSTLFSFVESRDNQSAGAMSVTDRIDDLADLYFTLTYMAE